MQVIWPNRMVTTIQKPATNQLHKIAYDAAKALPYQPKHAAASTQLASNQLTSNQFASNHSGTKAATLLQQQTIAFYKHTEDDQVDFYVERNMTLMTNKLIA